MISNIHNEYLCNSSHVVSFGIGFSVRYLANVVEIGSAAAKVSQMRLSPHHCIIKCFFNITFVFSKNNAENDSYECFFSPGACENSLDKKSLKWELILYAIDNLFKSSITIKVHAEMCLDK